MSIRKIEPSDYKNRLISNLPTRPNASPSNFGGGGLTATQMKMAYDAMPLFIIEKLNSLIDYINGQGELSLPSDLAEVIADDIQTGINEIKTLSDLFKSIENGLLSKVLRVDGQDKTLSEVCADIIKSIPNAVEIVQGVGDREDAVMSQKATSDAVSRMAKNVDASAELCGNIFPLSPSAWEQGSIDNTGAEVSNSRRIRTDYISTKDIASLRFKTNAKKTVRISIVYYTLSDGAYTRISESGWKTEDTEFPAVGRYDAIRIVGSTVTDGEINPLDVISLYSGASLTIEKNVDKDDIRIMQYNIGRYNYGLSGGLSDDKIQTKIANYKKFFGEHRPDIVCLQEYEQYMDNSETISADEVLFGELFPYLPESHYPSIFRSSIPYARYDSGLLGNNDTSTRVRYTLAQYSIKRKKVAVLSTALYYNNAESRAVQLNEAMALLSKFDYAIVCADMNYASQEEMDSLLQIASDNGFKACNGGFFGTFDTVNTTQYFKPIDNILVKGDVIIRNVFVPNVYQDLSSDHYPVIADIRVK